VRGARPEAMLQKVFLLPRTRRTLRLDRCKRQTAMCGWSAWGLLAVADAVVVSVAFGV